MPPQPSQHSTPPLRPRGPACGVVGVLLVALGACARPTPPEPSSAPEAAVAARAEPARDASVAPVAPPVAPNDVPGLHGGGPGQDADLEVRLTVRKPLRLTASGLKGGLVITVSNEGASPVEVVHPDVHGLRFVDTTTGATHTVLHPCDCGFVLGRDSYPESRHLRLAPGASAEVLLDQWDCGGGPFRLPPPGRYRVSWRLAAPAVPEEHDTQRLEERCHAVLRRDDVWSGAPESNAVEFELSREMPRSRK